MTQDPELEALLAERRNSARSTPHALLIREYNRQHGFDRFNSERFLRLCGAWRETPEEMAARIGMDKAQLKKRLAAGWFNSRGCYAESILLHQYERFIEWHHTRAERPDELFIPPRA